MRRRVPVYIAFTMLCALGCNGSPEPAAAGAALPPASVAPDFDAIAKSIVNRTLGIKEGQNVVITGSPRDLELLENLVIETAKVGGEPQLMISTERLARRSFDDVPAKYDSRVSDWNLAGAKTTDIIIQVDGSETLDLLAHVDPARISARGYAALTAQKILDQRKVIILEVGNSMYPTHARAALYGMSRDELASFFWSALNADFTDIRANAKRLQDAIGDVKELHITDANGTDVRFGMTKKRWTVSDGTVSPGATTTADLRKWLPAGEMYSIIDPGSAEGTIVVDRLPYQSKIIEQLTIKVSKGNIVSMTAASNLEPLMRIYDAESGPGKSTVSSIDFGVNPGIATDKAPNIRTFVPEGMVTISFGNDTWAGGTNNVPFGFAVYLASSTVRADGRVILENGRFKR